MYVYSRCVMLIISYISVPQLIKLLLLLLTIIVKMHMYIFKLVQYTFNSNDVYIVFHYTSVVYYIYTEFPLCVFFRHRLKPENMKMPENLGDR